MPSKITLLLSKAVSSNTGWRRRRKTESECEVNKRDHNNRDASLLGLEQKEYIAGVADCKKGHYEYKKNEPGLKTFAQKYWAGLARQVHLFCAR